MTTIELPFELTMEYAEGVPTFPFVEDENCNITGYGHQDKAAFAAEVNRYDVVASGEPLPDWTHKWSAVDITHHWVTLQTARELLLPVPEDTEGAIPVTTLWGSR